jgi:hypothetical protein
MQLSKNTGRKSLIFVNLRVDLCQQGTKRVIGISLLFEKYKAVFTPGFFKLRIVF